MFAVRSIKYERVMLEKEASALGILGLAMSAYGMIAALNIF